MAKSKKDQDLSRTIKMILDLSPYSLEIVSKVTEWAYNHTDQNDPDKVTDEDSMRYALVLSAINGPPISAERLDAFKRAVFSVSHKKKP